MCKAKPGQKDVVLGLGRNEKWGGNMRCAALVRANRHDYRRSKEKRAICNMVVQTLWDEGRRFYRKNEFDVWYVVNDLDSLIDTIQQKFGHVNKPTSYRRKDAPESEPQGNGNMLADQAMCQASGISTAATRNNTTPTRRNYPPNTPSHDLRRASEMEARRRSQGIPIAASVSYDAPDANGIVHTLMQEIHQLKVANSALSSALDMERHMHHQQVHYLMTQLQLQEQAHQQPLTIQQREEQDRSERQEAPLDSIGEKSDKVFVPLRRIGSEDSRNKFSGAKATNGIDADAMDGKDKEPPDMPNMDARDARKPHYKSEHADPGFAFGQAHNACRNFLSIIGKDDDDEIPSPLGPGRTQTKRSECRNKADRPNDIRKPFPRSGASDDDTTLSSSRVDHNVCQELMRQPMLPSIANSDSEQMDGECITIGSAFPPSENGPTDVGKPFLRSGASDDDTTLTSNRAGENVCRPLHLPIPSLIDCADSERSYVKSSSRESLSS